MSSGELTESRCLAAISSFKDRIVFQEVRNVYPQVKALNQMLEQVQTEYLIPLDADMILYADAFHRIDNAIDQNTHDPSWHSILFKLYDTLTQKQILALKVLRASVVKRFPFKDVPTPDIVHYQELTQAGYTCIHRYLDANPIGDHVVKGGKFCYNKYRDVYMTYRANEKEWDSGVFMGGGDLYEKAKSHFQYFVYRWLETENEDYLYCIGGMMDGITSPLEVCSKTLEDRPLRISRDQAIDSYMQWSIRRNTTIF